MSKSREALREWILADEQVARSYILDRAEMYRMSGCWIWQMGTTSTGYGQFSIPGKAWPARAHVASYESFVGPVPNDMLLRHKCDVRACCNPDHLEVGTKADNARDMVERGRSLKGRPAAIRGELQWNSRLNEHQIVVIHELRAEGLTLREIGAMVGCSQSNVSLVLKGKAWAHMGRKEV